MSGAGCADWRELTIQLLIEAKRTHMNPWSEVPYADYERHMSHETVGQLTLLDEITGEKVAQ